MEQERKCVIILSTKSSGSSVLQRLLTLDKNAQHISCTRHGENETLYWVKAASILGLPQVKMHDSEVPIPKSVAKRDLIQLLRDNVDGNYLPQEGDRTFIFEGWEKLCGRYAPVFIEKSPHHVTQWSSIELILEAMEKLKNIDFLVIGLVRNPMDTIYSMWSRWRSRPEQMQYEWLLAQQNLIKLKNILSEKLVVVKYEELVAQQSGLEEVYKFLGKEGPQQKIMHSKSLSKWKGDKMFGFSLDPKVIKLAENFGYEAGELLNRKYFAWPVYRELVRASYKSMSYVLDHFRAIEGYFLKSKI